MHLIYDGIKIDNMLFHTRTESCILCGKTWRPRHVSQGTPQPHALCPHKEGTKCCRYQSNMLASYHCRLRLKPPQNFQKSFFTFLRINLMLVNIFQKIVFILKSSPTSETITSLTSKADTLGHFHEFMGYTVHV